MALPLTPSAFEPRGPRPPPYRGVSLRLWSVRNAASLAWVYAAFESLLAAAAPLMARIGFERLERPVAFVERHVKGALFDCRMCGDCALSSTGLSCPMNCPKGLAQRPLRRRARQRPLRGLRRHALRLGAGVRGQPADEGRRADRRDPARRRPSPEGRLVLDRPDAEIRGRGMSDPLPQPHPHDIGHDPGAPLVDLPGHSSRGRLERVLQARRIRHHRRIEPAR